MLLALCALVLSVSPVLADVPLSAGRYCTGNAGKDKTFSFNGICDRAYEYKNGVSGEKNVFSEPRCGVFCPTGTKCVSVTGKLMEGKCRCLSELESAEACN
jgi:hypothetical protein